jgi:hypothetical protein
MNFKTSAFVSAAVLAALLGCSTPKPAASVSTTPPDWPVAPPPEVSIDLPLEPPAETFAKACQLGTTCLEMDPRPFEPCLLSTTRCRDKVTEPLLVGQPEEIAPPAVIKTGE